MESGYRFLPLHEASSLAAELDFPMVEHPMATNIGEAVEAAGKIGYPVAIKLVSPLALHKSEVGGVKLSIKNEDGVRDAFNEISRKVSGEYSPEDFQGVTVSPMLPEGLEAIIGLVHDPELGPAVMFGLGGVAVEIYRDVVFRLPPLNREDIFQMIREIKGFKLLSGYRGRPNVDLDALADSLKILSEIPEKMPEIIEMEINPLILYTEGCVAADVRIAVRD